MCRGGATKPSRPPPPCGTPDTLKICALPEPKKALGELKLARFMMLKNYDRNCTIELSEIFLRAKFLYTEKSRLKSFGPLMLLRPALPSKFSQYTVPLGAGTRAFGKELGLQAPADAAGTVGRVKQL